MYEMLKSKIHRAKITDANVDYEGSISICSDLMIHAGIYEFEKVAVADVNNGARFETYVIASQKPREICVNGAAARLVSIGDLVIIMAYQHMEAVPDRYVPKIILVDANNSALEGV